MRREKEMTRKKKVIIIIASALAAVLVLGAVAFTIYRNVQLERLRVFIVDSLLEKDGRSYSLSGRKELYDSIAVKSVYWHDINSHIKHRMKNDSAFRDAMGDDEFRDFFLSEADRPFYTAILYSTGVAQYNGFSMKDGYYKCNIEFRNDEWSAYCEGPYINANECTPTEFVRRLL